MAIDTSMYANYKLPDFVGAYQEGKDLRLKQDQLQKQKTQEEAMRGIYSMGPDGKMTINQEALKNYAQLDPQGAYKIHRDLDDARIREQQLIDERNYKRDMLAATRAKANEKSAELSSTEAKQLGLLKIGAEAENQYRNATAKSEDYDPTNPMEFIDNSEWAPAWLKSDKANQASSSQATWVENFLRDASGAAIPPSERMAYAKDYFPRPGDSDQVLANKQALREQKMRNAAVGSGIKPELAANMQFGMRPLSQAVQRSQSHPNGFAAAKGLVPQANAAQAPKSFKTSEIDWAD